MVGVWSDIYVNNMAYCELRVILAAENVASAMEQANCREF